MKMKKKDTIATIPENVFEGKVPPYSKELEMNILGGMLIDNALIDVIMPILKPDHFYIRAHQLIYKAIVEMKDRNETVDLVTIAEELKVRGELEDVGGPARLSELSSFFATMEGAIDNANKILQHWIKRALIRLLFELREQSYDYTVNTESLLDKAQHNILEITNYIQQKSISSIDQEVNDTLEYVYKIHEQHLKGLSIFGVPSGYPDVDKLTGGFQKNELIIIAGRPSHGKTAFALNVARNAALDYGKNVGIFSIEMSNRELALRFICMEAEVDLSKVKTGNISENEWNKIYKTAPRLMNRKDKDDKEKFNIIIDDSSPLSLLELRAKARRMKVLHNIDIIIIDYLQLMEVSHLRNMDSRYLEVGIITRSLKQLAKELEIPVIALSQLSRKVEERSGKDKRPQLSDLRESGSIEQDADVVMFVSRPEMFISKDDPEFEKVNGLAEIIIGKQRNGPIGDAKLTFRHSFAKFATRAVEPSYYAPTDSPF